MEKYIWHHNIFFNMIVPERLLGKATQTDVKSDISEHNDMDKENNEMKHFQRIFIYKYH